MIGTAVARAYYQPPGQRYQAQDYLLGEDVFRAAQPGVRDGTRFLARLFRLRRP